MNGPNDGTGNRFIAGQIGPNPNSFAGQTLDPFGVNKALFGVDAFQPDQQSVQLANMSSLEWQQAQNLMNPAATQLVNRAESPDYVNNARAQGITDATQQISQQQSARSRFFALQGINPNAAQSAALGKQDALGGAAAKAAAANQGAGLAEQTQTQILSGAGAH